MRERSWEWSRKWLREQFIEGTFCRGNKRLPKSWSTGVSGAKKLVSMGQRGQKVGQPGSPGAKKTVNVVSRAKKLVGGVGWGVGGSRAKKLGQWGSPGPK